MNKNAIVIVAAVLMAPMVHAAVTDAECKKALASGQMRKDCMAEAICLYNELERLIKTTTGE